MKSIRDTQWIRQKINGFVYLGVIAWLMLQPPACAQSNPVQIENTKPGTADWQLTDPASNREIEGYASVTSVNRGSQILFFVNTAEPSYQIEVFRVGWYGGLGARQMVPPVVRTGTPQVTPSPDPITGMTECNWSDPYVLAIPNNLSDPSDWASGVYLAKLTAATSGKQAYIVFVVRDDSRASDVLFQSAVTTYQAYNNWGGKSLYSFNSTGTQAVKVSFNRPYQDGNGAGYFLSWEIYMLRFLEREGKDLTYVTSVDMHANSALINSHKVFLSVGHDEYWSWQIRNNFEAARDHGNSLGFFAANVGYWQIRLDPSPVTGDPYRTQVCYKDAVTTGDPVLLDSDPSNDYLATTLFRNSPVNRPEDALVGVMYGRDPVDADIVIQNPSHWIFNNTGLNAGDHLVGLLGYEVDWMQGNAPQGTILLAHSPVPTTSDAADMTIYTATSGATVFATGSIQFSWGLDDYDGRGLVSAAAQQMTRNFFAHALGPDTTPPAIVSVSVSGPTTVTVVFSEPVASISAANPLNYNIAPGAVVNSASLGGDLETVTLSTSALLAGVPDTLTVNNVQDTAGNSIVPNSQMQFTYIANTATASAGYRTEVLLDSPLSYWRLGESIGTAALDVMGVNPGTYNGGYTLAQGGALPGDVDTAVLLNGATGFVSVTATASLNLGDGPLTLEAWVQRSSTNRNDIIFHKGTGAYQLLLTNGNRLAFTKANTATIVQSTRLVSDTAWHHVAVTKNGANVKLYLDGADVTGTITNQTLANATSSTLRLGTDSLAFFNGMLDEVAVYNQELSPARIAVHYAASALPASPNNLAATGISTNQINLSWTNNAKDVTGFAIERAPDGIDGVSFIQIGTAAASATSYADMGLNPVTTYDYRIKAYNTSGDSGYSNIASAATTADVPAVPTALTASAASSSQINLAWSDDGNREDGFKIERSTDGVTFSQIGVTGINMMSYSDTGLSNGTSYYYRVRSYNSVGNSAYSNAAVATTQGASTSYGGDVLVDTPVSYWRLGETGGAVAADVMARNPATYSGGFTLGQPGALSGDSNTAVFLNGTTGFASAPNSTSLSLADGPLTLEAWVKRNSINRTDVIIHKGTGTYQLLLNSSNHLALAKANTATIVQSTKLVADTAWHHVVGIKNGAVAKLYLDGVDVTGTVTNQTLTDATSSTFRLGTDSSTFFNGVLDEVAIYNYVLSPQRISLHYAASGLPAAPSALAANAVSSSQIDLAWTDNAGNEAGFNIERSLEGINFIQIDSTTANAASYSDTGLPATTTYYYRVRSFNTSGASGYSSVASATTGGTLPAAPSALTVAAASSSQINLSWADNSSNEDGFRIERSPDGVTFTQIAIVATSTTSYSDTGLAAATTYTYRVRAYNAIGTSAFSNTAGATTNAIVPAVPAAPSALTASAVSTSQVNLGWTDNATNEDGFQIERSPDGVSFTQIGTAAANATSYSDPGLTAATTYTYRVRAYNIGGNSVYSNTASATTSAAVPAAPSALSAAAVSTSQINLTWTDNSTNADGFQIERSPDGVTFGPLTTVAVNVTTYVDTGLTAGTTYHYRVRAYNVAGTSAYSNSASATTVGPLIAPSNLSAAAISTTRIDLAWTDNSSNEDGFAIERSSDDATFAQIAVVGANITSYSDTGLTASTTYYYRVRATSAINGNSPYSNTATGTTVGVLAAPGNLTATAASTSQINLSWTDNSTGEDGFKIEQSTDNVNFTQIANVGANVTTYSNTGLTTSTTYYYRVRATSALNGDSSNSNIASATTAGPLAAPGNLTATAISNSQINLAWIDNSSTEDGFEIEQSTDNVNFTQIAVVVANVTTYSNTGLNAATIYYYRVRATSTLSGDSNYSNTAQATTSAAVPGAPSTLSATAVSASQINLAWADNSSNESGFNIERAPDGINFTQIATAAANATSYSDTGLAAATTYTYRVRAYNASGTSAYSNTAAATTNAIGPAAPAAPSALTASAVSTSQINLSWTDNSTNEDGFQIERSPDGVSFTQIGIAAPNATSYSDTGLTAATTYTYRVRAYNTGGNSSYSNTASATTSAAVPAAPSAPSATTVSTSQINLTWTDNSTNEDGFQIERSPDGVTFSPLTTVAANITTYANAGLSVGTTYHYRVRAYNLAGMSVYSNTASATTVGLSIAPGTVRAIAVSDTHIDLAWADNSSNEDSFQVERSPNGVTFTPIAIVAANITGYSDTGLTASTTYYYRIRATSAVNGNSPYSNTATGTTVGVLAVPGNLTATTASTSQINLSWTDNSTGEDGFKIEQSSDNVNFTQIATVGVNTNTYSNSGLISSVTYYYRVRATSTVNGDSSYSNVADTTTAGPLAAPSKLSAIAISTSQINLAWTDNSSAEDGFKIEQSADNVNFSQIAIVGANVTTYSAFGLNPGATYYYRVHATSSLSGDSSNSNPASATTAATLPAAPTALTATVVSSSQINLAWTDNANNDDGFKIERSRDGINFTQIATTASNITSYSDTGLAAATTYTYRVRAYNIAGNSAYSNTTSGTTVSTLPAAPSALTATVVSSSQINLAWTDNANNESGFKVERSPDGINFTQIGATAANITSYSDTGLTGATTYYYRVRAYNASGDSAYSGTASATTKAVPASPSGLTATAASASRINLAWKDNSTNETGFKIERSLDGANFTQIATVGANVTTYANTGLAAGNTYYYRVRATNADGDSGYSNVASAATAAPAAPTNLTATAMSASEIDLNWTDNSSDETAFLIERSTDNITFSQIASVGTNVTSHANTDLTAGKTYYYRVRAQNAAGKSGYSNTASATTLNPPKAPSNLTAKAISSGRINLTWQDNSNNETGFKIERSTSGAPFTQITVVGANVTSLSDTGLTSNTKYQYRVRGYNADGDSAYSNTAGATTLK